MQRSAGLARAFFCAFSIFILSAYSPSSFAQERPSQAFAQIGPSLQNFHYKETDTQGAVLDREDGLLPGVEGGIGIHNDGYTLLLTGSLHRGTVTYDGQTQYRTPLTTDTEERIVDVSALIKFHTGRSKDSLRVIEGLGFREWRRDIQSTGPVLGLYEIYRWRYLMLGVEADVFHSGPWKASFDVRLTRPVHPTIEIEAPGYDPFTLELGAHYGMNLRFPVEYRFAARQSIVITPYWQTWKLGHSNHKRLYANGVPTPYTAQEPDSETVIFGVSAAIRFMP
jgi:hypothetical protein